MCVYKAHARILYPVMVCVRAPELGVKRFVLVVATVVVVDEYYYYYF